MILDDLSLIAAVREHVAGDERVEELLTELELRFLENARFALHALSTLQELVEEATKVARLYELEEAQRRLDADG